MEAAGGTITAAVNKFTQGLRGAVGEGDLARVLVPSTGSGKRKVLYAKYRNRTVCTFNTNFNDTSLFDWFLVFAEQCL
jgi:hypothetical protein